MQVVLTGAAGALGQALLRAIAARGSLLRADGLVAPVRRVIAVDRTQPAALFLDPRIEYVRGDYEQPRFLARMMGAMTDSVFHLSALGAGTDELGQAQDLDTALLLSLDTTRALLDACGFQAAPPVLVFASTLAARAQSGSLPATTEGVCAALCELLLMESSRRRIIDLRCLRLPCITGGAGAEAIALEVQLADIKAGRAPPDALRAASACALASPGEAAQVLIEAQMRGGTLCDGDRLSELAGRFLPLGELMR